MQVGPTCAHASLAADHDLARPTTCAPLAASELMVSKPMPELATRHHKSPAREIHPRQNVVGGRAGVERI